MASSLQNGSPAPFWADGSYSSGGDPTSTWYGSSKANRRIPLKYAFAVVPGGVFAAHDAGTGDGNGAPCAKYAGVMLISAAPT